MVRRKRLFVITLLVAAVGIAALFFVFAISLYPSKAIKNQRVLTVNVESIPLNGYRLFDWAGKPVLIFRPGSQSIEYLIDMNSQTSGLDFDEHNIPKIFAYEPISTYKGCLIHDTETSQYWESRYKGWYDPFHMGLWDFSGRNITGVNTPEGVLLPDLKPVSGYSWISDSRIEFKP